MSPSTLSYTDSTDRSNDSQFALISGRHAHAVACLMYFHFVQIVAGMKERAVCETARQAGIDESVLSLALQLQEQKKLQDQTELQGPIRIAKQAAAPAHIRSSTAKTATKEETELGPRVRQCLPYIKSVWDDSDNDDEESNLLVLSGDDVILRSGLKLNCESNEEACAISRKRLRSDALQ